MALTHSIRAALLAAATLAAAPTLSHAQTFATLRSYWSAANLDNGCTTSASFYSSPPSGYGWYRDEGLTLNPGAAAPPALLGMLQLDRWYSPSRGDYFTTSQAYWQGGPGQTRPTFDYIWQAHDGWIFPNPVAGTSELRLYYSSAREDNFTTSDPRYNAFTSVPGYINVGVQGYIVNDPLGQTSLIPSFNFGTLHNGGPATGNKWLAVMLMQYSDYPMRHTSAQVTSTFFGLTFPFVNGYFYANSMYNWLWINAGVYGPYTVLDDPDTTGNESKWRDTWDPTYAPFLFLALRAPDTTHWISTSGGAGSGASAAAGFADAYETFTLADINGGNLISGDTVAFKNYAKTWLRVSGTSVLGDGTSSASTDARFVITKVSGAAGTQIVNNDVVRLRSVATNQYLRAVGNGGGSLVADTSSPGTDSSFTIFKTGQPIAAQIRDALRLAYAAGESLDGYDDNHDGTITSDEVQFFIVGSGPTSPPADGHIDGAATRWGGVHTIPGSSKTFSLGGVAGGGEDMSLMTICHELTHNLGVGYEMYGAEGVNQDMTLMGATIYGNIDDRRTYDLDPWTRMRLGWLHPRIYSLTDAGAVATLEVADDGYETTTKRPILLFDPFHFNLSTGEGEFFMLEYRNPNLTTQSYDTNCNSQGVAIWQCKTGPGGTNLAIPSIRGACCNGAVCGFTEQVYCSPGWTFKGNGTVCDPSGGCPAGSPPPVKAVDGSVNMLGSTFDLAAANRIQLRGNPTAWTQNNLLNGHLVPQYIDGSSAPVVIRVGPQTTTGRTVQVEWSFAGDLPSRIDSISAPRVRRSSRFTLTGMFPLRSRQLYLHDFAGTYVPQVESLSFSNSPTDQTVGFVFPSCPIGTYKLIEAGSLSLLPSNEVQIQITYRSDWNLSGTLTVQDIFDFLNDWFAGHGDFSGDGFLTTQDIFDFLNGWFAGT